MQYVVCLDTTAAASVDGLGSVVELQAKIATSAASPRQTLEMRRPKEHINIRIVDSGSKGQYEGDSRNQGVFDPHVADVVFRSP